MALEVWELVAAICTAIGVLALVARHGLSALNRRQIRRLARDGQALQRWWAAVADLPADVLTPPLRRTLGRIMYRRLAHARRLHPQHPLLRLQRADIARFVARPPTRLIARSDQRVIDALIRLRDLLEESASAGLVSYQLRISADAAVARHLTRLEFLRDQRANLESDYLRRVTRALGAPAAIGPQLAGGNSALPTQ